MGRSRSAIHGHLIKPNHFFHRAVFDPFSDPALMEIQEQTRERLGADGSLLPPGFAHVTIMGENGVDGKFCPRRTNVERYAYKKMRTAFKPIEVRIGAYAALGKRSIGVLVEDDTIVDEHAHISNYARESGHGILSPYANDYKPHITLAKIDNLGPKYTPVYQREIVEEMNRFCSAMGAVILLDALSIQAGEPPLGTSVSHR